MLKKIGILVGCLLGAFLVAAIVLPFVVDVDKFRPQIVKAVNDQINGDFALGKLQLSLWGGVKVKIDSLSIKLKDANKPLLSTESAYVAIPFWSILIMSPRMTVVLDEPRVEVIQGKDGKLNLMRLMKTPGAQADAGSPADTSRNLATEAPPAAASSPAIPAIAANASIGFRINKGDFSYIDEVSNGNYAIKGVELDLKNLGLKETIRYTLELPIVGKSPTMEISGLVTSEGNLTPVFASGTVKSASGKITLDATKLAVKAAKGAFDKSAKMPLVIDLDFDGTEQDLKIKTARVKFHEVEVNAKGLVTLAPEQAVRIDVQSSSLPLASLADFVPMLKQYQLQGAANLFVSATGPIAKIAAKGEFGIKGGKASYPEMLKAPINFELKTAFTENSLNLSSLDITGPGSDARLVGTVVNFAMPQFKFTLSGKQIDIDQLLKLEAKKTAFVFPRLIESAEAAKNKPAKSEAKPAQASPATGVNPMAEMAKNPMMLGMAGQFNVEINKLIAKGAVIENIRAKSTLKNLVFNLESASLKTFEGLVDASANADLKSPGLGYSTKGSVKGLSSKAALTQYFPKFKDTVDGKMNANWNLAGQAFPEAIRMRSMNGTMNLNAANGRIRSINVQESLAGVIEKVPFLKGKNLPKIDEGFETMRADVKLAGGVIDANPFEMVGGGKGLTIKGKSKIQESLEQETFVDVYDPNQLLPKEISNGKDVAVALRVFGPISAPKTDYEYTVTRLAKNAIKNEGQKVLQKGLQKFLGGKGGAEGGGGAGGAPASGGDAVKDALKKIKLF